MNFRNLSAFFIFALAFLLFYRKRSGAPFNLLMSLRIGGASFLIFEFGLLPLYKLLALGL